MLCNVKYSSKLDHVVILPFHICLKLSVLLNSMWIIPNLFVPFDISSNFFLMFWCKEHFYSQSFMQAIKIEYLVKKLLVQVRAGSICNPSFLYWFKSGSAFLLDVNHLNPFYPIWYQQIFPLMFWCKEHFYSQSFMQAIKIEYLVM